MAAPGVKTTGPILLKRATDRLEKMRTDLDTLREVAWTESIACQDQRGRHSLAWLAQRILDVLEEDQEMANKPLQADAPVAVGRS